MPLRIRYAVVGLGHIAQSAVLPAFQHARRNSELTAIVSGDRTKLRELGRRFEVDHAMHYDDYDALMGSGAVDAVYIALPNHLHREYAERAARAGIHVLCEKPMAMTVADGRAMIRAAERHGVKLMIAYRLHFDEGNLEAAALARDGTIGDARLFTSTFTMDVRAGDIRLRRETGGGPLYDIGIYCINAARMIFRDEPVEALARSASRDVRRFAEVAEMESCVLRYPGERVAAFSVSFGAADVARFDVVGTKGTLSLESAYNIAAERVLRVRVDERERERRFPPSDQFAPELAYFSDCILHDRDPEPSGAEGLADVQIIEALIRSARSGRPERLRLRGDEPPTRRQAARRPPVRHQRLVRTRSPSR